MPDLNDQNLVRKFAREKSEAAFAALVRQHVNLVFATALRQIGDRAAAEEITQSVFVALAQSAGKLGSHPTIAGWLHQTTLNKSREWLRSELRRRRREEIAVSLAEARAEGDSVWAPLVPLLDEALLQLRDADRAAVIMHFMEGRTFQEVGSVLGVGEDTARKRVDRCLEQMTKFFQRQGFTVPTLSATAPLFALASHTAPTGLAASATAAGVANHSATTLTLKGALKIMAWTKAKTAIVAGVVVLLAAGTTIFLISQTSTNDKPTTQEIAKQTQDAYATLSSYSDSGTVAVEGIGGNPYTMTFSIRLARPNLYRIHWAMAAAKAGLNPMTGTAWSDGSGDYVEAGLSGKMKMDDMQSAVALGTYVSGNSAINIPGTFFQQPWGDLLSLVAAGKVKTKMERDEQIGDVDCNVISLVANAAQMRDAGMLPNMGNMGMATSKDVIWIGKHDHLIYQIQSSLDLSSITTLPQMSDAEAKRMLELAKKPVTPENIARLRKGYQNNAKAAFLSTMKSGKLVFTETHENISVNEKSALSDFAH